MFAWCITWCWRPSLVLAPRSAIGLHWNDDPTDNRVENLRWGTYSDNNHDRVAGFVGSTHLPDVLDEYGDFGQHR